MKTNDLDSKFLENALLMFLASTLFVFSFGVQTAAQPGGCYSDTWRLAYCREERNKLLQKYASEIEDLSKQIVREPTKAEPYYERGQAGFTRDIYWKRARSIFKSARQKKLSPILRRRSGLAV
jgi:hypothetical protein